MKKQTVAVDLDGVVADFDKNVHLLGERDPEKNECNCPENYFTDLDLIDGALEALHTLNKYYDLHFLSTPQWSNSNSWKEKCDWVKKHFGELMFKKLTLTHHKNRFIADYLIDDNVHEGFAGEHIHFGTEKFPDWQTVTTYLIQKYLKNSLQNEIEKLGKDMSQATFGVGGYGK